jgi:hypothetical protein
VATWKDDPAFTALEQLYVSKEDRSLLVTCSYGGILYKELRCAWVHKYLPESEEMVCITDDDERDPESLAAHSAGPYYRYTRDTHTGDIHTGSFSLWFQVSFLAVTVESALSSFERKCSP